MAVLLDASLNATDRKLNTRQPDEDQEDEISCCLHLLDLIDL